MKVQGKKQIKVSGFSSREVISILLKNRWTIVKTPASVLRIAAETFLG